MRFLRASIFILLTIVFVGTFGNTTFAQEKAGIKVIPASIEEGADPGTVISKTLKITNESDAEKEYYIYKKNITGVEDGGVPVFSDEMGEKTGYEITEWIEIQSESIKVGSYQTVDLPFVINVPDTATPGSHFGGIFVSAEPPKLREIGAGVGYEVASVVSIRISGDILDAARVRSFSTDKLLYSSKHVEFTAKIENQGNILIRPRGPVTITNMFGSKPEVLMVNETQAGVFPGTMRDLVFNWDSEELGFGRYEAILALAYDGENGQKTIDATLIFWIFPIKIMLTILGAFLAVIIIGYFMTKYYINQAIIRAAGGRRITTQRYRKQVGISRFTFVFVVLMIVFVLFLLVMLIFSA
ncbi:MAG: DUF916 domain-containing protein [Minisyncoccia bacterium]